MSKVIECSRDYHREKLNFSSWNEFFAIEDNTPYVYENRGGLELCIPENIVGYLSDITFNEFGFTYKFHFTAEDLNEEKFLTEYVLEPIFHQIIRGGKVVHSEVQALEIVKTGH